MSWTKLTVTRPSVASSTQLPQVGQTMVLTPWLGPAQVLICSSVAAAVWKAPSERAVRVVKVASFFFFVSFFVHIRIGVRLASSCCCSS
mgnify:CR=1 FL=1